MFKKVRKSTVFQIIKDSVLGFTSNDSMTFAASTAFYTIFSMPALLIIILNIGSAFYVDDNAVRAELLSQVSDLSGPDTAKTLDDIIQNVSSDTQGFWARTIAIGVLAFSATTVFVSIQNALNAIWKVKPQPQRGYVKFIIDRLLSFALVITLGFLMMVSLLLDTILALFKDFLTTVFSGVAYYVVETINFSISFLVISFIFAMILKFLPDAKIKWSDVRTGAIVTTVLFILGKFLISIYLGNSDFESTYGAAGSLVVILMWVYYSSVILLLGAEFTQAYAKSKGRMILPASNAVKVEIREVELINPAGEKHL